VFSEESSEGDNQNTGTEEGIRFLGILMRRDLTGDDCELANMTIIE
jgi:hypothetical protein